MSETRVYPCRESMAAALAEQVAHDLKNAIKKRGRATLAVPGGSTPSLFFQILSERELDWKAVTIIPTDERFVPESSERSNARLIRQTLMQGPASKATFIPFWREAEHAADVLPDLCAELEEALPIDVAILGMGADMHTASLFPNADNIEEALGLWAKQVMVMHEPDLPETRLTLTAPVLERARKAHLLIAGEDKKKALREAQKVGMVEDAPVRIIINRARKTTVHYSD